MFTRTEKKSDVFLIKEYIIIKADMKSVTSQNPDTLTKRIRGGADQASRVVIDIVSNMERKQLIEGLRNGIYRNKLLKEILIFYKGRFFVLPRNLIDSNRIFDILK